MANLSSLAQLWPFFVRICILSLVFNFKIIALGDDNDRSIGDFTSSSQSGCKNTNFQIFLPPPYQNISSTICKPVWHTYELRVSSILILDI